MALMFELFANDKIIGALRDPGEMTMYCSPFRTKISASNAALFLSDVMGFERLVLLN
jgi:hypothetical protein